MQDYATAAPWRTKAGSRWAVPQVYFRLRNREKACEATEFSLRL